MDLKEAGLVDPSTHWYYVSKGRAIERMLAPYVVRGASLLEVGAGSGYFARLLVSSSRLGIRGATCIDTNYPNDWNEGRISFQRLLPGTASASQVLLLIDVLEHVADDQALLRASLARLEPGGVVVITVPAFQSLWGAHDVYLEHFRRYRLSEIVRLAEDSGLEVRRKRYLFGALFPVAFLSRRVFRRQHARVQSDMRPVHPLLDRLLRSIFAFEHRVIPQRLIGLSAVVVASKRVA